VESAVELIGHCHIPPNKTYEIAQKIQDILTNEQVLVPLSLIRVLGYPRVSELYNQLYEILKNLVEDTYAEMPGMQ
jgi:hypothetical protein